MWLWWWWCKLELDAMRVHPGTTTDATHSGSLVPVDMTPRPCTCVQGSQNYQPLKATMKENQHMTMNHARVALSVHMPKPRQTQRRHPSARHGDQRPWCCRTNCCALRATFQFSVPFSVSKTKRIHPEFCTFQRSAPLSVPKKRHNELSQGFFTLLQSVSRTVPNQRQAPVRGPSSGRYH